MPCDPCQEMEPQGAEHRRGLWLEEVGELASLLSCSRWPGGPAGLQQGLDRLERVCLSLAGAWAS